MDITKEKEGTKLTLTVTGRLDTTTSPELEKCISQSIDGISDLLFDFTSLEYISSAGLRVLLSTQKKMNKQGNMKVCHVNKEVYEIFEVTGFSDFLNIE